MWGVGSGWLSTVLVWQKSTVCSVLVSSSSLYSLRSQIGNHVLSTKWWMMTRRMHRFIRLQKRTWPFIMPPPIQCYQTHTVNAAFSLLLGAQSYGSKSTYSAAENSSSKQISFWLFQFKSKMAVVMAPAVAYTYPKIHLAYAPKVASDTLSSLGPCKLT